MIIKLINAHGENVHLSVKIQLVEAVQTVAEIARQQRAMNPHITRAAMAKHIGETQPITQNTAAYYLRLLEY
jgi:hypothetical protein